MESNNGKAEEICKPLHAMIDELKKKLTELELQQKQSLNSFYNK